VYPGNALCSQRLTYSHLEGLVRRYTNPHIYFIIKAPATKRITSRQKTKRQGKNRYTKDQTRNTRNKKKEKKKGIK
jgi:hypothetical protein